MMTKNQATIALVKRLDQIIEERKALEKEEAELKSELKSIMGTENQLRINGCMVIIEQCYRSILDGEALKLKFGRKVIERFTKVITYDRLTIKKTKR